MLSGWLPRSSAPSEGRPQPLRSTSCGTIWASTRNRPTTPGKAHLAVLEPEFLTDLTRWVRNDRAIALRVLKLADDVLRHPAIGIGKPEPMKFNLQGCWSRRVTQEHRLVYLVRGDRIHFLQARYHY